MPKYDAENFDPPAPVAYVTLRNSATGVSLSDIPMLIDQAMGILGRNILNSVSVLLGGINEKWEEYQR